MRIMNCIVLSAVTAVAIVVATPAQGQDATTDLSAGTSSVRVFGTPPIYRMNVKDFQDFGGTYLLSNGQQMILSSSQRKFYMALDGAQPVEIVPVSFNSFITRSTGVRLSFGRFHQGRVHDLVVSAPLAPEGVDRIRISAR